MVKIEKMKCPFCERTLNVPNLWMHIKQLHKDEWEKWQSYHFEWNSHVSFMDYLRNKYYLEWDKPPEKRDTPTRVEKHWDGLPEKLPLKEKNPSLFDKDGSLRD